MFVLQKKDKAGSSSVVYKGAMLLGYFGALRAAYFLLQKFSEGK
jgi:hypothetical protein